MQLILIVSLCGRLGAASGCFESLGTVVELVLQGQMLANHGRASQVGSHIIKQHLVVRARSRVVTRGRSGEPLLGVEQLDAFHLVEALVANAIALSRVSVGATLMHRLSVAQLCGRVCYHGPGCHVDHAG